MLNNTNSKIPEISNNINGQTLEILDNTNGLTMPLYNLKFYKQYKYDESSLIFTLSYK